MMKLIEPYSFGMGDRFAHQGRAQLQAVMNAGLEGIRVVPTWNKSNREHGIIGTEPASVLAEARAAVADLDWQGDFYIDADHINLGNVERFIEPSNFFTIDVADYTGKAAAAADIEDFVTVSGEYQGTLTVPDLVAPLTVSAELARRTAEKFLWAMQEAGRIYRHIRDAKGGDNFITEVSVDETDTPQTPAELLLILLMLAREGVPVQTIAPKFTGRFNKGVDYIGEVARFEREFDEDLSVLKFAVREFGLPLTLKLSVHSGSDKFSLYPIINHLVKKHGAGLHVKTAGTTWLEEVIGLAEAGGTGLTVAKEIYALALGRYDELLKPYAPVVDINPARLPSVEQVNRWTAEQYVNALRHDQSCPDYNLHFRQFIHVSFKIAAELRERYTDRLREFAPVIASNVTTNLLVRHLRPIFGK